jgi:hypothetical protein
MDWRRFWTTALGTTLGLAGVDPYGSVRFSLPLERAPITQNQRFSYPAIARSPAFDSLVMGTSTSRLLRPAKLDELFGGRFANLSLNSGTAYEQTQLLKLFARHNADARTVILGIDIVWCEVGERYEEFTFRPFPPWLYDENPWNDLLHVFNLPTIEQAGRLIAYLAGLRERNYDPDGYANFLPPPGEYDLARVRRGIYGTEEPRARPAVVPPASPGAAERRGWRFPTHALMREMLSALPADTLKVLYFVPYHHYGQPAEGSPEEARWQECKRRLTRMAGEFRNAHVLDFMFASEITRRDENYWDMLHYTVDVADRVSELIALSARRGCGAPGLVRYLTADEDIRVCVRPLSGEPRAGPRSLKRQFTRRAHAFPS